MQCITLGVQQRSGVLGRTCLLCRAGYVWVCVGQEEYMVERVVAAVHVAAPNVERSCWAS